MQLQGKVALITGASGVIGGTIAKFFAREGCNLVLSGRSLEKLHELAVEISRPEIKIYSMATDVSRKDEIIRLAKFTEEKFGSLDIVVTAAGLYGSIGALAQCEPEEWMKALEVNLFGTAMTIKYCLPLFKKENHNKIITFAGGGEGAMPNFSSYVSSKGAVLRLVETLAEELKTFNIDINSISPGAVKSGFSVALLSAGADHAGGEMYKKTLEQIQDGGTSPEKAASLAVFLASSASDGLTGRHLSAVWDRWQEIPKNLDKIMSSDIYTFRRIKPKDRGYDW